jgi:tetratricopeptide (TPR) repeat protein
MDADAHRVIGNYRIVAEIARGAFGIVYRAEHTTIKGHVVAIKQLHTNRNSPEAHEGFLKEAQILAGLEHPFILSFRDYGMDGDVPYLVTKYATEGSLRERIPDHRSPHLLPMEEVLTILSQIGQALHYIHQKNIVHCDLKPQNILFDAGKALLADFGIAVMTYMSDVKKDAIKGTLPYMAPEQFRGQPTARSDQYAFATITYELFTGHRPFSASSIWEWQQQHVTKQPTDPRELNHEIPEYRAQAILKALAKNPADRHADTEAFLVALRVPHAQETIVIMSQGGVSQKDVDELVDKGYALLQAGRPDDALEMFNQAIRDDPKSAKAFCGRGGALIKQGGHELDALTAYNDAIIFDPEFIPAHIGRGDVFCSFGDYRQALEAYQKVAQTAPDAALYQKIADTLIKLEEYEDALVAYDAAIRYGANPIEIHHKKIALLVDRKRYREAAREYDHIIRLSSDPISACYKKREFLFSIKRYDEAFAVNEVLATYEQLIKLKRGAIDIYYEEIAALEKLADNSKRLAIYDYIIKQAPDPIKVYVYYKEVALLEQINRSREVPAICDRIIKLVPGDLTAHRKKLAVFERLEWPKDALEDALVTCDQIIERVPDDLNVYRKKRYLLERLKQYDQVVDTCNHILALDPKCHETYHRRGNAYEMLEKTYGGIKDNVLSVRLTPVSSRYLDALDDYTRASQLAPNIPDYRASKEKLLKYLWKPNQARLSQNSKSRHPTVSWLFWLLSFVVLPTLVNAFIGVILLGFLQQLWMMEWVAAGAFCISVFGTGLISIKDKPYHLYHASILFYPISCFAVGWLIVGFLTFHPEVSVSFIFPLVCLFVIVFLINAVVYFLIDLNEEHTFVLIGRGIDKIVEWVSEALIEILRRFAEICRKIIKAYKDQREQQRAIADQRAKEALTKKTTTRQELPPKASPTLSRARQNPSPRQGSSVKKPAHSASSKGFQNSLAKQARTNKKPIPGKKSNNRRNW